jgi:hypothetical protein
MAELQSRPHTLCMSHYGCKGTIKLSNTQIFAQKTLQKVHIKDFKQDKVVISLKDSPFQSNISTFSGLS